ncbi:MAG: NAD(+) diphosphatase [Lachnospiraceae bacterium]|nr:NAD(+) diphosphatase [Lachnospiraceae bacterium]
MLIQYIGNHTFNNEYKAVTPCDQDLVIPMNGADILLNPETDDLYTYDEVKDQDFMKNDMVPYVFSVDDKKMFLPLSVSKEFIESSKAGYVRSFGKDRPELQLAGATAMHLKTWYTGHRYCGCCGGKNEHDAKERAMKCTKCGHLTFPVICPAIIVAVVDGDRILLTKSHRPNAPFSLIAGFTEIGETLEQTCSREAMEECGVKIKNIRPFINQPWGFSSSLMLGFFAELDGSDEIHMQESEIKDAQWFTRETMPVSDSPIDITHHMMELWRQNLLEF